MVLIGQNIDEVSPVHALGDCGLASLLAMTLDAIRARPPAKIAGQQVDCGRHLQLGLDTTAPTLPFHCGPLPPVLQKSIGILDERLAP